MGNVATLKTQQQPNYPAFSMSEEDLLNVLGNSLYPGAQTNSIKMVIEYCRASNLDPMQKPVHIVPIYDGKLKQMRDVVMPGIGLYRSQASRSGEYAGVSEPEFGEDVTENFEEEKGYEGKVRKAITVTYPKWCRVTVKRLLGNGSIVEFTAKELWKENYATAGKDSQQPNAMWSRRPYAQLAKCAEAQALRKAFPEFGAQPTSDEMEGKELDITPVLQVVTLETCSDEKFAQNSEAWKRIVKSGKKTADGLIATLETKGVLTESQRMEIKSWEPKQVPVDDFVHDIEKADKEPF